MPEPAVRLVLIDPYDRVTGLLAHFVTQRILDMARTSPSELSPEQLATSVMSRVYGRDPNITILAFVDENSKVVGHAVASIETDGITKWVFVAQCRADGNVGDAVSRAVELADEWGRERGAVKMLMATNRADSAWKRKYGFDTVRHIMLRNITGESEG